MNYPSGKAAVLVTGASSGIGKACALAIANHGVRVFAGVRSENDLKLIAAENINNLTPIILDVTRADSIAGAVATITAALNNGRFIGLVNNAGIMVSGPIEFVPHEALQMQLEVNVVGQIAVTRAFLALLREHKGRIINIGSTSGHIVSAMAGPYCASKFALLALTNTLRMELRPWGIHVAIIEPGVIATPIWEKVIVAEEELANHLTPEGEKLYGRALAERRRLLTRLKSSGSTPEIVSGAVLHALLSKRPKTRYVLDLRSRVKMIVGKFLPDYVRRALTELRRRKPVHS